MWTGGAEKYFFGTKIPFPGEMLYTLSGTSVWRPQSRYTVSRTECRIKFSQNQRCRAKTALHPPRSRCRTFLWTPLSHLPLIRSRQGVWRAGRGYRGTFGFRKWIALRGGTAAAVTPVALLCATKSTRNGKNRGSFEGCWHLCCLLQHLGPKPPSLTILQLAAPLGRMGLRKEFNSMGYMPGGVVGCMSGGPINLPKFLPMSFFRRVSRFIGVSGRLAFQ